MLDGGFHSRLGPGQCCTASLGEEVGSKGRVDNAWVHAERAVKVSIPPSISARRRGEKSRVDYRPSSFEGAKTRRSIGENCGNAPLFVGMQPVGARVQQASLAHLLMRL